MPEAVRIFIDSHDMGQVSAVQKDILRLYRQDIGRYALEGKTLVSNGFELRYLNKQNVGELDFVIQKGTQIIPLEIKSGKDYRHHAALNHFTAVPDLSALAEFGAGEGGDAVPLVE